MIRKLLDKLKYKFRRLEDQRFVVEFDYLNDGVWTPCACGAPDHGGKWDDNIREYVFTAGNAEWFMFYRKSYKADRYLVYRRRRVY